METKTCTRCGKTKLVDEFHKNKRYKDGRSTWCKECHRNQNNKNYELKKPEVQKKHRQYYEENKKKVLKNQKRYYESNRKKILKRNTEYQKKHRRECWVTGTLHSHAKSGHEVCLDRKDLLSFVYDSDECEICGCKLNWGERPKRGKMMPNSPTLDRVDNEGILAPHNVQIACKRCNTMKHTLKMKEFVEYCKMIAEKFSDDPTI